MEGLGLTWFDGVAIVIIAFSGIMAFARGLIREVFSIVAFIGAALAAYYLANYVQPFVVQFTALSGVLATLAAGLLIFLVVFIAITVITSLVARTAHQSAEIGGFDRIGGAVFGVLRGILVMALFVLLMRQTTDDATVAPQAPRPSGITSAQTYPAFEYVAIGLERLLPQARQRASDYIEQRRQRESAPIPPADPAAAPAPAPAEGQTEG
ncbi:MAG: CvpA family protein [Hyphomonadaceae bacterium]